MIAFLTELAAVGNFYISRRTLQQQRRLDERSAQDEALQTYLNKMSELLDRGLHTKRDPYDLTRVTARAWTQAVLRQLDGERKRTVLLFLREARLINDKTVCRNGRVTAYGHLVGLTNADLRNANLRGVELISVDRREAISLEGANLEGAVLVGTNLERANLQRVVLKDADLRGVSLYGADLSGADLSDAVGLTNRDLHTAEDAGSIPASPTQKLTSSRSR